MEICHDVCIAHGLQPLNGESMSYYSAVVDNGAHLDIYCCLWFLWTFKPMSYIDIHVFNPYAPSYRLSTLTSYFCHNEQQKKEGL